MKNLAIRFVTWTATLFTCILILGFILVAKEHFFTVSSQVDDHPPTLEAPQQTKNTRVILALGDSLTRGTGDPEGKGYVGKLVEELDKKSDQKMTLYNWAIKGQKSDQLLTQVKESEIQRQIKQADLILITIGGNDLFQGGQSLVDLNPNKIGSIKKGYLENVNSIFTVIRSLNKEATIYHIGLYNPFIKLENADITSKIVREWNYESAEIAAKYPKIVAVPTFDLFELQVSDYLYTDQFHPNAEGYQLIAERVASLITW